MSLVSSVRYYYQINGYGSKVVQPRRGLNQEGPHHLFTSSSCVLMYFLGYSPGSVLIKLPSGAPTLTHLFFLQMMLSFFARLVLKRCINWFLCSICLLKLLVRRLIFVSQGLFLVKESLPSAIFHNILGILFWDSS